MTPTRQAPYGPDGSLQHRAMVTHRYLGGEKWEAISPEWRPNKPFRATLKVMDVEDSRRGHPHFVLEDRFGAKYPVFVTEMLKILQLANISGGQITAWWVAFNRGGNYSLRLATPEEVDAR